MSASVVGQRFTVEVGPIAHGGHCVARVPLAGQDRDRVVFVRHAITGEQAEIVITEGTETDSFWRADAVEILRAGDDRVSPVCPHSGPDGCGGCDFQHVDLARQRDLKAEVVREQLQRLAGLDLEVEVEAVPGDEDGLGWRTRMQFAQIPRADGSLGTALRKHRSHELVKIETCPIQASEPPRHQVRGHDFQVPDDGFWQVHPGAPEALVSAVLAQLAPREGERALDLYAGVGLFSRFLADAVGDAGLVTAIEGDRASAELGGVNVPGMRSLAGPVAKVMKSALGGDRFDLVVLDPPRTGAKRKVVEQIVGVGPRAVCYVACDPAAFARDVAIFAEHGFSLRALRSFDAFPMTHHVECVGLLERLD